MHHRPGFAPSADSPTAPVEVEKPARVNSNS